MDPSAQSPNRDLEQYRSYLALLAKQHVPRHLQGRIDLSGVIQQTLLEAHQALRKIPEKSLPEPAPYLRKILANNLADELRKLGTAARDVSRERSLEDAEQTSLKLGSLLAAEQSSPSQQAIRNELMLKLTEALAALPEDQRLAVELHHLQGCPLADIASQMNRSKGAVAQLLFRAMTKLREALHEYRTFIMRMSSR
jgi:RNA polymerase sigma-70 factor (ECF subfamily)